MKNKKNIKGLLKRLKTNLTNRLGVEEGHSLKVLMLYRCIEIFGKLEFILKNITKALIMILKTKKDY